VFGEFQDLPVHALVIHAVVVLVPLAAALGALFAIPKTQRWARHAFPIVTLGATAMTFVARQSGIHLMHNLDTRGGLGSAQDLVGTHESRGKLLFLMMIGFSVVAVAAWVLSRDPARYRGAIAAVVSAVVIVGAVVVSYQVYRVGEIGSKMVWNPDGTIDFDST
jgi:uncharacterized membrane protein